MSHTQTATPVPPNSEGALASQSCRGRRVVPLLPLRDVTQESKPQTQQPQPLGSECLQIFANKNLFAGVPSTQEPGSAPSESLGNKERKP